MPTSTEYYQLEQDLIARKAAVEQAVGRVRTWFAELDLTPERMSTLEQYLQKAGEFQVNSSSQVGDLITKAQQRKDRCKEFSDEYLRWKWEDGTGYGDPKTEPKRRPGEDWLELY